MAETLLKHRYMIVTNIIGGLGNQMFQYAFGRAASLFYSCPLYLDLQSFDDYRRHQGFELSRVFGLHVPIADHKVLCNVLGILKPKLLRTLVQQYPLRFLRGKRFVCEPVNGDIVDVKFIRPPCYMSGYWQAETYFQKFESQIRADFRFPTDGSSENYQLSERIVSCNAVSLHVRRGDYASDARTLATHGLCSMEYYNSAIDYICKRTEKPVFFVFSDDDKWAKANLQIDPPVHYITHNRGPSSFQDMRLMHLCRHHIIANSSFSWWGAWLNSSSEKIVIAPERWFADPRLKSQGDRITPKDWVRL